MHGEIISNWRKSGKQIIMNVTVPCNSTATIYIPSEDAANITESGIPVSAVEGVKFLRMENSAAVYSVPSGNYTFKSTTP